MQQNLRRVVAAFLDKSTLAPRRPSCDEFDADALRRPRPLLKPLRTLRKAPRPLLKPLLLLSRTTHRPPTFSSAASKASTLSSTDCTRPLKRQGRMGADCTGRVAKVAMRRCALSTLKVNGASRMSRREAVVHAAPMLKAAARWRTVARVYGRFLTASVSSINRACRW